MEFSCAQKSCGYSGKGPYVVQFPQEAVVDIHNIATPFCPYCGQKMIRSDSETDRA